MRKLLGSLVIQALVPVVMSACSGPAGEKGEPGPAGPPGAMGDKGDPGTQPGSTAQLVGLVPASVFSERTAVVQLSGTGTHFAAGTSVTFDDAAITVSKVTVGGPGYLSAEITVGRSARFGAHDVTVDSAAVDPTGQPTGQREVVTLKGVFSVAGTLAAEATGTSKLVDQGGIVDFNLRNVDRDNPFAGSGRLDGGARTIQSSALGGRMIGTALVDALASPGGLALHASFDKLGYALDPASANAPQVKARPAKALTLGTALSGEKLAAAKATNLYKLTTGADAQVLVLSFATTGGLATNALGGALAPSSGRFAEGQIFYASQNMAAQTALLLVPQKGDAFIAVHAAGLNGGADWGYDLTVRGATARVVSAKEGATPDGPTSPLVDVTVDGPLLASDGALDGPADLDYVRCKAGKTGRLFVQATTPWQSQSPSTVAVTLLQADCATALAPQRPLQQETAATMDTTYCAVLTSPAGYIGPYQLIVAQDL